jgi:signal transduction histidine kinase
VLALAAWVLAVSGVAVTALTQSLAPIEALMVVLVLSLPSVGALVAIRRPRNPIGWMLLGASLAAFGLTTLGDVGERMASEDGGIVAEVLLWVSGLSFVGVVLLGIHVPLRFPDGNLPSPAWRRVERLAHLGSAMMGVGLLLAPGPLAERDVANPFGVDRLKAVTGVMTSLGFLTLLASAGAALASLVVRGRRGSEEVRQQLRWLLFAASLLLASVVLLWVNSLLGLSEEAAVLVMGFVTLVVLPASMGMAILRHRALDIDLLIRRSLVYGVLWLIIGAVHVGVSVAMGVAAGTRLPVGVAVVLTVLATLVFSPARRRLEGVADRWVFGPRSSPPQLLAGLGTALASASEPDEIAANLATTLRAGLRLRWVEVRLGDSVPLVVGDVDATEALVVSIAHGDECFGTLRCGPREDTGALDDPDTELATALAAHTGLALHSVAIAARLVEAHETERRRIERNIHDGAQQQLVALMARLGVARQQLSGTGAEATLVGLQRELRVIMEDLRALAQGIHPSVLTDGGLVEAVAQRCDRLPVAVSLDVDDGLAETRLTDEIEGAGYFVVSEALANVLKHADAHRVAVRIGRRDGHLLIDVSDDGVGFDARVQGGGLGALADRVAALGGTLEVDSERGVGTRVRGRLPLREVHGANGA